MKINLKNRFTLWILTHPNLLGLLIFILAFPILAIVHPAQRNLQQFMPYLYTYLGVAIIWGLLVFSREKWLYYLRKGEGKYLWLKKTATNAELGTIFWREKGARYYKIFFGDLPTVRVIHLKKVPITVGWMTKCWIKYLTCWVDITCYLKGDYNPMELYQKVIKEADKASKANNFYSLREYIQHRLRELVIEVNSKETKQIMAKYKKTENKQDFITAMRLLLRSLKPADFLSNCDKLGIEIKPDLKLLIVHTFSRKKIEALQTHLNSTEQPRS